MVIVGLVIGLVELLDDQREEPLVAEFRVVVDKLIKKAEVYKYE